MKLLLTLALSLALTVLLEEAFALLYGLRSPRLLALTALVNLLTNPPVVLLYYLLPLGPGGRLLLKLFLEGAAIAVEGFCYKAYGQLPRPFWFSFCANVFSYGTGFILGKLI